MDSKTYKITFFGDIMCEPPLLEQVKSEEGYDFSSVFQGLSEITRDSDYVIGNLETPIAGESAGYSDSLFSFNSPDSLLREIKKIGISMVSTANNHTMDRDFEGLIATLDALDAAGIEHTGTYRTPDEEHTHYFTIGDTTIALISYTYSTNYRLHHKYLDEEHIGCINYLMPFDAPSISPPPPEEFTAVKKLFKDFSGRDLSREESTRLKVAMHIPVEYADDVYDREAVERCLRSVEKDCADAQSKADIVIFYPHMGGQFNVRVGAFSDYVMKRSAKAGFDAIIGGHAHTIQKAEYIDDIPCFYSLGNVSQSPISVYSVRETLPEYGLAVHLYITESKIQKTTYSIFKILESDNQPMEIMPISALSKTLSKKDLEELELEVGSIIKRISGQLPDGVIIREEYNL